ncbi:MAG: hypothetical protein A2176_06445 [Spirochaetes bacterium RBG_13_51_14]|nr:MAG: hypothetical protein A2176_06445 [Spirochaetes bacterium RBG_13_51_14]
MRFSRNEMSKTILSSRYYMIKTKNEIDSNISINNKNDINLLNVYLLPFISNKLSKNIDFHKKILNKDNFL